MTMHTQALSFMKYSYNDYYCLVIYKSDSEPNYLNIRLWEWKK